MTPAPASTPAQHSPTVTSPVDPGRLWLGCAGQNIVVGLILIVQAVAVVALSNDFTLSGHRRL